MKKLLPTILLLTLFLKPALVLADTSKHLSNQETTLTQTWETMTTDQKLNAVGNGADTVSLLSVSALGGTMGFKAGQSLVVQGWVPPLKPLGLGSIGRST